MKHVYETSRIAPLWACKAQTEARNKQGNFYFKGNTIYSYGHHFPIARHVTNDKGDHAILITTRDFSVTTRGHCYMVQGAICKGNVQLFRVEDPSGKPTPEVLDAMQQGIDDLAHKAYRARTRKPYVLGDLRRAIAEYKAFATFIGVKLKPRVVTAKIIKAEKFNARVEAFTKSLNV